jgi:hypothetical protein
LSFSLLVSHAPSAGYYLDHNAPCAVFGVIDQRA